MSALRHRCTSTPNPRTSYGPSRGCQFSSSDLRPQYRFRRVVIRDNWLRTLKTPHSLTRAISQYNVEGGITEGNVIDVPISLPNLPMEHQTSQAMNYFNNQSPSGQAIQGFDLDTARKVDELRTRVEDALFYSL